MRRSVLALVAALAVVAVVLLVVPFFASTGLSSAGGIEPLARGPFMTGPWAPPSGGWQSYDASASARLPPQYTATTAPPQATTTTAPQGAAGSRVVVKEGFVRLIVSDVEVAASRVLGEVERLGGYLVKDEGGIGQRTLTVRVPSDKLDEFVAFLGGVGMLESFSVSATDVTETYVDLGARLNSTRALEKRLLELLSRAGSVDEVLKVEGELSRVRAEIERLEAELRSLSTRVAYSTVVVTLVGGAASRDVVVTVEVDDVAKSARGLVEALGRVGRGVRGEFSDARGVVSVEIPTGRLDEVERLIPGRVVERRESVSPSSTGVSTVTINLVGRSVAYAVEIRLEVPDVEEAFRALLGLGVGRVEQAAVWGDGGVVVISLPPGNSTRLEELLPGRVVSKRTDLVNARESRYTIRLQKRVDPVAQALQNGVEALKFVALALLALAIVLVPLGLAAYGGYAAYMRVKKRKAAPGPTPPGGAQEGGGS